MNDDAYEELQIIKWEEERIAYEIEQDNIKANSD